MGDVIRGHFNAAVGDAFDEVCPSILNFSILYATSPTHFRCKRCMKINRKLTITRSKGIVKNSSVENEGLNEIGSRYFGTGTKVREGALLEDGGKPKNEVI